MHQENMIAAGDHPVPIDLEMILQAGAEEHERRSAGRLGLRRGGRNRRQFRHDGRLASRLWTLARQQRLCDRRNDRGLEFQDRRSPGTISIPTRCGRRNRTETAETNPNLPHVDGRYAKFGDHVDDFVAGFEDYANFLSRQGRGSRADCSTALPAFRSARSFAPTRFYYMLLQRLRNHRTMDDGVIWSAQADFIARLADWRASIIRFGRCSGPNARALLALNVPHFVSPSDGNEIGDADGHSVPYRGAPRVWSAPGRAFANFDEQEIAWQIEVISENTNSVSRSAKPSATELHEIARRDFAPGRRGRADQGDPSSRKPTGSRQNCPVYAIRRGPSAAWIGLDWLGDSEVSQLVCLGPDLYNGVCGIGVFLRRACGGDRATQLRRTWRYAGARAICART